MGSIVVYGRKKVFTAYILIISDAAEKLHLAAELEKQIWKFLHPDSGHSINCINLYSQKLPSS